MLDSNWSFMKVLEQTPYVYYRWLVLSSVILGFMFLNFSTIRVFCIYLFDYLSVTWRDVTHAVLCFLMYLLYVCGRDTADLYVSTRTPLSIRRLYQAFSSSRRGSNHICGLTSFIIQGCQIYAYKSRLCYLCLDCRHSTIVAFRWIAVNVFRPWVASLNNKTSGRFLAPVQPYNKPSAD